MRLHVLHIAKCEPVRFSLSTPVLMKSHTVGSAHFARQRQEDEAGLAQEHEEASADRQHDRDVALVGSHLRASTQPREPENGHFVALLLRDALLEVYSVGARRDCLGGAPQRRLDAPRWQHRDL